MWEDLSIIYHFVVALQQPWTEYQSNRVQCTLLAYKGSDQGCSRGQDAPAVLQCHLPALGQDRGGLGGGDGRMDGAPIDTAPTLRCSRPLAQQIYPRREKRGGNEEEFSQTHWHCFIFVSVVMATKYETPFYFTQNDFFES